MDNLFTQYYPSLTPEEYDTCDAIELDGIGSLLYTPLDAVTAHICGLVIHPDQRGRGYARQLLDILKSEYLTLTANILFTEVNRLPFWQHQGFVVTETNIRAGFIGLKWERPEVEAMIDPSLL